MTNCIDKDGLKILIITDSPNLYTGLGRVSRHLVRGLSDGNEVFVGAWGWDQEAYPINDEFKWIYEDESEGNSYVAFPLSKNPKKLIVQTYEVMKLVEPDVIITVGDYWNFAGFELLKEKFSYSFRWIAYLTIESHPINEGFVDFFNSIDKVVTPSMYGKRVVESSTECKSCAYVPYGVNDVDFYKLEDETIQRERDIRGLNGKFRFINVGKNTSRKNLPAFMQALKRCNDFNPDIVGYLHTNVVKIADQMIDVNLLIDRFELNGILEVPKNKISIDIGFSDIELNIEYNCSDAIVMTSVAEGFGLPIIEGQKCGLIPVVTDSSAMSELVENRGELVKSSEYYSQMEQAVDIVDNDDLFCKMMAVVEMSKNEKEAFLHRKKSNEEFSKKFDWNNMVENFIDIVGDISQSPIIPVETM